MANKAAVTPKPQTVALSIRFELQTRNELRKVIFGLDRGTKGGIVEWKINFELYERQKKTDKFVKLIDLDVEVQAKNKQAAEQTATKGMTERQTRHALRAGAAAAKRFMVGKTTEESAKRSIERTMEKR